MKANTYESATKEYLERLSAMTYQEQYNSLTLQEKVHIHSIATEWVSKNKMEVQQCKVCNGTKVVPTVSSLLLFRPEIERGGQLPIPKP